VQFAVLQLTARSVRRTQEDAVADTALQHASIVAAWKAAASDLGIGFISPFDLISTGSRLAYLGMVPDFGSPKGTLLASIDDSIEQLSRVAERSGFFFSALAPQEYSKYDRVLFVETLVDWGWFGAADRRPTWLTRAP